MSLHIFGSILTAQGVAANNRGETEGNITTLQKLLWKGNVHTTVSAEAIRWAIRYYWQQQNKVVNRRWNDEKDDHEWQDPTWEKWTKKEKIYIDDDVLGFMKAEGAKAEGEQGKVTKRRGVLEIARAVSTTPYAGDITFNSVSGKKGSTSLYGTEVHCTRYQYSFALTPERLREKSHAIDSIDAILNLGEVAGNQSRFLFDFSPDSIILRLTSDPAPRILYCFEEDENSNISILELIRRIEAEDIEASELYVGGPICKVIKSIRNDLNNNWTKNINYFDGVKNAVKEFKTAMKEKLEELKSGGDDECKQSA